MLWFRVEKGRGQVGLQEHSPMQMITTCKEAIDTSRIEFQSKKMVYRSGTRMKRITMLTSSLNILVLLEDIIIASARRDCRQCTISAT